MFSAPAAVEWLTEASPMLASTIASAGQRAADPSRAARPRLKASPTALGRCEAIVEVTGITFRSAWPRTLCRPLAIGSASAAARPSSTSRTPSLGGAA